MEGCRAAAVGIAASSGVRPRQNRPAGDVNADAAAELDCRYGGGFTSHSRRSGVYATRIGWRMTRETFMGCSPSSRSVGELAKTGKCYFACLAIPIRPE